MHTQWRTSYCSYSAVIALSVALAACGGGSGGSSSSTPPHPSGSPTAAEQIRGLEASGALPKLDRSASIAGPDADTNGVRDDVQQYIGALPDSQEQKRALAQMSAGLSAAMLADTASDAQLRAAASKLVDAVNCIWRRYDSQTANAKVEEIRKVTVNTRQRFEAYAAYNKARSGAVVALPSGDTCQ